MTSIIKSLCMILYIKNSPILSAITVKSLVQFTFCTEESASNIIWSLYKFISHNTLLYKFISTEIIRNCFHMNVLMSNGVSICTLGYI